MIFCVVFDVMSVDPCGLYKAVYSAAPNTLPKLKDTTTRKNEPVTPPRQYLFVIFAVLDVSFAVN